jgi:hypothetical protein
MSLLLFVPSVLNFASINGSLCPYIYQNTVLNGNSRPINETPSKTGDFLDVKFHFKVGRGVIDSWRLFSFLIMSYCLYSEDE